MAFKLKQMVHYWFFTMAPSPEWMPLLLSRCDLHPYGQTHDHVDSVVIFRLQKPLLDQRISHSIRHSSDRTAVCWLWYHLNCYHISIQQPPPDRSYDHSSTAYHCYHSFIILVFIHFIYKDSLQCHHSIQH